MVLCELNYWEGGIFCSINLVIPSMKGYQSGAIKDSEGLTGFLKKNPLHCKRFPFFFNPPLSFLFFEQKKLVK